MLSEMLFYVTLTGTLGYDPCGNYTVLDNAWRAPSNRFYSTAMCDRYVQWVGWYRLFINGQSAQVSNTCIKENGCGTHATLWINGPHPSIEDGVVTRDVCGNWNSNCCNFKSTPINVKACPGQYYVYEFKIPIGCHLAYCAGNYIMCVLFNVCFLVSYSNSYSIKTNSALIALDKSVK